VSEFRLIPKALHENRDSLRGFNP